MASGLHSRAGGGRKPEDPSFHVSELRQQDSWDVNLPADKVEVRQDSWDPNLPKYDANSGTGGTEDEEKADAAADEEEEENSPYPEVRASVPNYDEDLPANTIRAWTLGLILAMVGAGANTLFSIRNPPISIQSIVAQLAAYFLGRLWAKVLPNHQFNTFGVKWNLNPGPFNVKEHTMVVVMANVSYGTAYATDIILAQVIFYKQNFGIPFQLLMVITTQTAGYGIAGLLREYLVYPAAMVWPVNLMGCTVLHAMHEKEEDPDPTVFGGRMSKYRWFAIIMTISFFWYFVPGFLAQFLSMFVFMTWIYPNNPVINQLFGSTTGLGLIPITFDWTQISTWVGNPLTSPWSAIANTMVGIFIFYIIMPVILHYKGAWYAQYLPMLDAATYDNTGSPYNTSRVATPQLTLNEAEYKAYSPLFLSTGFAITYGLSFATIAALVVHVWIYHRHEIVKQFKKSRDGNMDIHMKLMQKYPETPWWWYGAVFVVMIILSLVMIIHWPTEFTWWAFLFSIAFSAIFTLPIGIIQAITNQQLGLNVITEFIMGYMQPGRPLALMLFKTYGYISATQALSFISDLKLGHYMKIPPRTMFWGQTVATILSCFVQVAVLNFSFNNIPNVCDKHQPAHFTCPSAKTFFSASVIWGLLGPQRIFSPGQVYSALLWGFPIGFAIPIIFWAVNKYYPRGPFRNASAPLILGAGGQIPPATPYNYMVWAIVGWVFQKYIKTRHWRWWARLNYLTGVGLDTGLALSTLFIFFCFTMTKVQAPNWWGNNVVATTMDQNQNAIQVTVPDGQTFGPTSW